MINWIHLQNYRIHKEKILSFKEGINFIIGPNSSGKTSILEALYFFSYGKSFKKSSSTTLTHHEEIFFLIEVYFNQTLLKMFMDKKKKIIQSETNVIKQIELANILPITCIHELDNEIISGEPESRRNYFNEASFMTQTQSHFEFEKMKKLILTKKNILHLYKENKINFHKCREELIHFNHILQSELLIWTQKRKELCLKLHKINEALFYELTQKEEPITLSYIGFLEYNTKSVEEISILEMQNYKVLLSPLYDRYLFLNSKKQDVSNYYSKGDMRSLALSLKLSLCRLSKSVLGKFPVILVDDLNSELDNKRIGKLIQILAGMQTQVILTATQLGADLLNKQEINIINIEHESIAMREQGIL